MITSPLIQAILDGRINIVRDLIKNNPEMLGICSEVGSLPYQIAVNKGLADQQTALLRAKALGSENFEDYSELLIHYLGDISYFYGLANWLYNIEFIVWKVVFNKELLSNYIEGCHEIDEETKEDLRFLSRKVKGWAVWRDGGREPVVVSDEEWNKIWESYQNRKK